MVPNGPDAIQLAHAEGKIALRGLDKKVVMVCHQAIRVADPVIAFVDVLEGVQEVLTIGIVFENGLLLIAP